VDRDYWEDRAKQLGARAGGYRDAAMDAYEERLRRSALSRLLGEGQGRSLLDAGCGSGRWSILMAAAGWSVTGVDFSRELIAHAPPAPNVAYIAAAIQDLDLPASSFDAWLSVTALQHITADGDFEAALSNLTRMLRAGGTAAVLEYAPLFVAGHTGSYLRARSRSQWIDALTAHGYVKTGEAGVRFLGHIPYMLAVRATRPRGRSRALEMLRTAGWAVDLGLSRVPVLTGAADVRLLLFEKR
jgi:ubiquinone/menaquinone biosynthesis C-methylase UbiE